MWKISNLLNKMEKDDFQVYLLFSPININYLSNYNPEGWACCKVCENPVIYCTSMDYENAKNTSDIDVKLINSIADFFNDLKGINKIAIEPSLTYNLYSKLMDDFEIGAVNYINELRMIKSDEEITKITRATKIAQESLLELDFKINNEKLLSYEFGRIMREKGAFSESFPTILASGSNTSLPHSIPLNKSLEKPILIDWGCIFEGYCSDNTRTIVYTEKEHEVFDIVLEAHDKAIDAIKPGLKCSDIDKIARDIISDYGYGDKFIHGLGHGVGLEVQESPSLFYKNDLILEKGMVVTVEPGIYLEGEFGVRIEDTIEIQNSAKIIGNLPIEVNIDLPF